MANDNGDDSIKSSVDTDDPYSTFRASRSAFQDSLRQKFGPRLRRLLEEKGWSQSELARRADIPRDSVSTYILKKTLPGRLAAEKMAKALGISVGELFPEMDANTPASDMPVDSMLDIHVLPGSPAKAHLRVNKVMRLSSALKIAEIIAAEDSPDRS